VRLLAVPLHGRLLRAGGLPGVGVIEDGAVKFDVELLRRAPGQEKGGVRLE
jgi:hypothetical protein